MLPVLKFSLFPVQKDLANLTGCYLCEIEN